MKYRYTRKTADMAADVDLESLLSKLSELMLASGFDNPWDPQSDDDRMMQALHDAILEALLSGEVKDVEGLEELSAEDLKALIAKLVERSDGAGAT